MVNDEYGFYEEKDDPDMIYEEYSEEIRLERDSSPKITIVKKDDGVKLSGEEIKKKVRDPKVINVFKKIKDPEIDMDIWTLGLIYDIEINENKPEIKMTFTSPMCPFGPQIVNSVKSEIAKLGYDEPSVDVVFKPLWEPSEEVKDMLGISS